MSDINRITVQQARELIDGRPEPRLGDGEEHPVTVRFAPQHVGRETVSERPDALAAGYVGRHTTRATVSV